MSVSLFLKTKELKLKVTGDVAEQTFTLFVVTEEISFPNLYGGKNHLAC